MSELREEDRQKNGCPSRGLGLAAAAIGVGVGAALYYFFSKRPENPANEGATSQDWSCESPQTLDGDSTDSYSTMSEHTTTDTSINEDSFSVSHREGSRDSSSEYWGRNHRSNEDFDLSSNHSDSTSNHSNESSNQSDSTSDSSSSMSVSSFSTTSDYDMDSVTRDDDESDVNEWEMEISVQLPHSEPPVHRYPLRSYLNGFFSFRLSKSRERSWSLEECSICFEVILRNQEVMSLPCTHHFHQACILPWLQEQQTCPNCRKSVD